MMFGPRSKKKAFIFTLIFATIAAGAAYIHKGATVSEIHILEFPLLLAGPTGGGPLQLLPKGTTLYYDKTYPEGFTRYKIYVNIDRFPLPTHEAPDPTAIKPIMAFRMDKEDLKLLLEHNPVSKDDLVSILRSKQLTKEEIREILAEYSK